MPLNHALSWSLLPPSVPQAASFPDTYPRLDRLRHGPISGPAYPVKGRVFFGNGNALTGASSSIPARGMLAYGRGRDGRKPSRWCPSTSAGGRPGEYKVRMEPGAEMTTPKKGSPQPLPFAAKYRDDDGETG